MESEDFRPNPFDGYDVAGWEPTDDVEVIEDPTEDRLRWRAVRPDGSTAASGFHTRSEAFRQLSNYIEPRTIAKLDALNHEVAGWASIEADGWKIIPSPVENGGAGEAGGLLNV